LTIKFSAQILPKKLTDKDLERVQRLKNNSSGVIWGIEKRFSFMESLIKYLSAFVSEQFKIYR
jgi:hypothetical protein